jgi:integrase
MPKLALADRVVANLTSKSDTRATDYFDLGYSGLCVRVTPEKRKTFYFVFTSPRDGNRAWITLGLYPALALGDARDKWKGLRQMVDNGQDPRDVANGQRSGKTVEEMIEDRLKYRVRGKLRSARLIEYRYNTYVIPIVGKKLVKEFRIRDLMTVTDPLVDAGKFVTAKHVFDDVRAMMRFAVTRDEIDYSPLDKAERPFVPESTKTRELSLEEIKWLWNNLDDIFIGSPLADGLRTDSFRVKAILKLMLATGQRPTEVCGIHRAEIDRTNRLWTIPAARSKNGWEHVVPLNDVAWAIIMDALERTNSDFIFPNDEGDGPFDGNVLSKTVLRAFETRNRIATPRMGDMKKFTPHDLRRTVATQMSLVANDLEIPDIYISHVLNHRTETRSNVTQRVYNKNTYLAEKRIALKAWGDLLQDTIDGKKRLSVARAA